MVKQAGEGSTLKVTGLLPSHVLSDSFSMQNCSFKFPIHPIFVIQGLHQNVNISLPFLQKYKFIIDLETENLHVNLNNEKFSIPFVLKNSASISTIEVLAKLPNSGIQVLPRQEVLIKTAHDLDEHIFSPRAPRIRDSLDNDFDTISAGVDINLVPWQVSRHSTDPPGSIRVRYSFRKKENSERPIQIRSSLQHFSN